MADVCIKSNHRCTESLVFVLKGSRKNLLGLPDLRKLNLLAMINSLAVNAFDPVKLFPRAFERLETLPGMYKIHDKKDV